MDSDSECETAVHTETSTKSGKIKIHGVTLDVTAVSPFNIIISDRVPWIV